MTRIKLLAVSTALAVTSFLAGAAPRGEEAKTTVDTKIPLPIQTAIGGGMKLEKTFQAAGGLTGWVLSQGVGSNLIVYTPANGEVALAGTLLDATGQNLTKVYLEQHAPKPDYNKLWSTLDDSAWVAEGAKSPKSVVYVFMDPNCSYCHLAWKAVQPYEKIGLQVRWVQVGFLAADSVDKAAALLAAPDGAAALAQQQNSFGSKAASPVPAASKEVRAKVEANTRLMNEWGFRGTPATLYKDKTGKVQALNGMFDLKMLPAITGLPEQQQTDPALARFK